MNINGNTKMRTQTMPQMKNDEIAELIQRRRLQVLIHSCIYYEFNESIISDTKWSEWALELEQLQAKYPKIANKVRWASAIVQVIIRPLMKMKLGQKQFSY